MTLASEESWLARARRSALRRAADRGPLLSLEMLPPHASLRRYARAGFDGLTEVVMLLPPPGAAPEEAGSTAVSRASDEPFLELQRWFLDLGVRVPALFDVDDEEGTIWLEDVGHTDFDAHLRATGDLRTGYRAALDTLLQLQRATAAATTLPHLVSSRSFDAALLRWELDHYREWRLEQELGLTLEPEFRTKLDAAFDDLVAKVAAIPTAVMHRDFQSHNLMVLGDELVVLDFQDAMTGPVVYDAVALLRDSYVEIPADLLSELVRHYARQAAGLPALVGHDAATIERWFFLQTVQRKLKDSGRFVFIERVKKNPNFLPFIPSSLRYVKDALGRLPELAELAALLAQVDPALRTEP